MFRLPVCRRQRWRHRASHMRMPMWSRTTVWPAVVIVVGTGFMAGCGGSSLNNETLNSELGTGLSPTETAATANTQGSGSAASVDSKPAVAETAGPAPAAAVKAANTFTSAATPGNTAYKIGPQDVLEISVFKVPELSRSVQVADAGTVNLPLVGEVPAAGMTAREFERELTQKLGAKYLQSPQVTVYVKEYNSQRVTIEGAVNKPGVYPIRGKTSLLQFVAIAGGLSPASDSSNVVVFRNIGGKRSAAKFDMDEIRAGNASDPAMQKGDVIVVSESAIKAAFQNVLKAVPLTNVFVPFL